MFHVKHRPTYKELRVYANAFLELRSKIRSGLCLLPKTSGGQVLAIECDPDTDDLLVTWQYADGQRTHRITITEEPVDVSRGTSTDSVHGRLAAFLKESDQVVAENGGDLTPAMTKEEWDIYMQGIARRAAEFEDVLPSLPDTITPPADMTHMVVAMLQATIDEAWREYGGDPVNAEQFWNFLVGNGAADVPRETSSEADG